MPVENSFSIHKKRECSFARKPTEMFNMLRAAWDTLCVTSQQGRRFFAQSTPAIECREDVLLSPPAPRVLQFSPPTDHQLKRSGRKLRGSGSSSGAPSRQQRTVAPSQEQHRRRSRRPTRQELIAGQHPPAPLPAITKRRPAMKRSSQQQPKRPPSRRSPQPSDRPAPLRRRSSRVTAGGEGGPAQPSPEPASLPPVDSGACLDDGSSIVAEPVALPASLSRGYLATTAAAARILEAAPALDEGPTRTAAHGAACTGQPAAGSTEEVLIEEGAAEEEASPQWLDAEPWPAKASSLRFGSLRLESLPPLPPAVVRALASRGSNSRKRPAATQLRPPARSHSSRGRLAALGVAASSRAMASAVLPSPAARRLVRKRNVSWAKSDSLCSIRFYVPEEEGGRPLDSSPAPTPPESPTKRAKRHANGCLINSPPMRSRRESQPGLLLAKRTARHLQWAQLQRNAPAKRGGPSNSPPHRPTSRGQIAAQLAAAASAPDVDPS
ncbi:hypothetical protein EMIHUDRAFT_218340 [Emiliania huxleyi CCMP1516]|uniref:Uncharacterized protein n=2 Tax=Emiliania huxleyi TaxID=2903 RepID=A0A0D3I844_EMIH1|nr:hypothetical protein EMIHUDRAFT_218340 [Emiliania huxleyi CCMP1516]EOD07429.1 hypothetical protein EMIHUDRAFT_218340 [Emiliania huxleyi CCMP1516]|eukprot:XP_005759858.1 hypothetical protein EMIHUDRAFT_218340 [Emiliania huxleyi CCMP1516]